MYRIVKGTFGITAITMFGLLLAGCGGNEQGGAQGEAPTPAKEVEKMEPEKPVTLKVHIPVGWFTDDEMQKLIYEPLKKKAPHITLERREGDVNKLLAAGDIPDLIVTHSGTMLQYAELGIMSDLNELVQLKKFDLNRFDPAVINTLKMDGKLMALPYAVNFTALYFNKDIFEKFGVPFPKDGMTWDDAIDLAKRVTREDAGTKYRGIDPETISRLSRVLGIDNVDYKSNKATVVNDGWKTVFDIYKKVFSIPGNMPSTGNILGNPGYNEFFTVKTLAMYPSVNRFPAIKNAEITGLNWDVAQYPSMPGKPGIGTDVDAHIFAITAGSKHREAAMNVIEIVTSDELQMTMTRETARLSPLKDPSFSSAFAADFGIAEGKNIAGIFKSRRIEAPIRSMYLTNANKIVEKYVKEYVEGVKDLNTALRSAEEEIDKYIATQAGK